MIISGKEISIKIKDSIKEEVENIVSTGKRKPKLVVILVGDNQASQVYVRNKENFAPMLVWIAEVIRRMLLFLQEELIKIIQELNNDTGVDGILVHLPLPKHIDSDAILKVIDPKKDVDGFHPQNVAKFFLGEQSLEPCTPKGMMVMLDEIGYDLTGRSCCGRTF